MYMNYTQNTQLEKHGGYVVTEVLLKDRVLSIKRSDSCDLSIFFYIGRFLARFLTDFHRKYELGVSEDR